MEMHDSDIPDTQIGYSKMGGVGIEPTARNEELKRRCSTQKIGFWKKVHEPYLGLESLKQIATQAQ